MLYSSPLARGQRYASAFFDDRMMGHFRTIRALLLMAAYAIVFAIAAVSFFGLE